MRRVLITGSAGFIGFHLARLLLREGFIVHGYDGMTDYYEVSLKERRHAILRASAVLTMPLLSCRFAVNPRGHHSTSLS
mgnify:CR=1 FL=1